ncbi:MAG: DUF4258 domain-containing protein [Spirochaetaceae bacterium]|nr:MAG: DUF4258 domain-containing protein [Spirochaetaceae bacterium]
MKSITEQWIQRCVEEGTYYFTAHADEERMNDALSIMEVEQAMANARIIEYYEDSGRGEK